MQFKDNVLILILSCGVLLGCGKNEESQLANPASLNCSQQGGQLQMAKRGDGGEYGICLFGDNRQCEEWALFRGECPVGGIKITGYVTPEGTYCAIKGGTVLENETLCDLPSGKKCSTKDHYNGTCPAH